MQWTISSSASAGTRPQDDTNLVSHAMQWNPILSTAELLRSIVPALSHLLRRHNSANAVRCVGRNRPVGNPDVDQRLHRLRVPIRKKAVELGDSAKVDEARIEVSPALSIILPAQVPERVNPVRMIEMRVDAEDLAKARAAVVEKCLRKASALADPIATVSIHTAGRVRTHGSCGSLGREGFWVVDLAIHPPLD